MAARVLSVKAKEARKLARRLAVQQRPKVSRVIDLSLEQIILERRPYVYQLSVNGVVKYFGKGRHTRVLCHEIDAKKLIDVRARGEKKRVSRFKNCFAKAVREGKSFEFEIIEVFKTDEEAFDEEVRLINSYPKGELWNTYTSKRGMSSDEAKALAKRTKKKRIRTLKKLYEDSDLRERQRVYGARSKGWCNTQEKKEAAAENGRRNCLARGPDYWTEERREQHGQAATRAYESDPTIILRMAETKRRRFAAHPEDALAISERNTAYFADPVHRQEAAIYGAMSKGSWTLERRAAQAARMANLNRTVIKELNSEPARKAGMIAKLKKYHDDPEQKKLQSVYGAMSKGGTLGRH